MVTDSTRPPNRTIVQPDSQRPQRPPSQPATRTTYRLRLVHHTEGRGPVEWHCDILAWDERTAISAGLQDAATMAHKWSCETTYELRIGTAPDGTVIAEGRLLGGRR